MATPEAVGELRTEPPVAPATYPPEATLRKLLSEAAVVLAIATTFVYMAGWGYERAYLNTLGFQAGALELSGDRILTRGFTVLDELATSRWFLIAAASALLASLGYLISRNSNAMRKVRTVLTALRLLGEPSRYVRPILVALTPFLAFAISLLAVVQFGWARGMRSAQLDRSGPWTADATGPEVTYARGGDSVATARGFLLRLTDQFVIVRDSSGVVVLSPAQFRSARIP